MSDRWDVREWVMKDAQTFRLNLYRHICINVEIQLCEL